METWVVSCIIHVFGVLAEYALILKIIQSEKRRDAKVRGSDSLKSYRLKEKFERIQNT